MGKYEAAPTVAAGLIRTARDRAQLTQTELAELAGVTQQNVSAYETGRKQPTLPTLTKLLNAAGLEMRIRLAPLDPHDESVEAFIESLPSARRTELEAQRRERVEAARLKRIRGG